ncbi:hypothetical protein [Granulicella sibirica]|uniref:Uncharacterized protein n=1 Tax=Granulicella sibirica TaxID=2479048 RepID=A0A4Q0T7J2_9BACT|nr:hypothetical protein [Granulicella sibirica]RXH57656.1 hypothetical protein GRAN_0966 [Granulicella sibirica]
MQAEIKAVLSHLIQTTWNDFKILQPVLDVPGIDNLTKPQAEAIANAQEALEAAYAALKAARAEFL